MFSVCKSNNISKNSKPNYGCRSSSEVHTKETFLQQFAASPVNATKSDNFIKKYYRHRNLHLARMLDSTVIADHPDIKKQIMSLRWCNKIQTFGVNQNSNIDVIESDGSCKSNFCQFCCRSKSAKLSHRLEQAFLDTDNNDLFKGKGFYFLTLTLKHDNSTRYTNYISDLKDYINKLKRSRKFNDLFVARKSKKEIGIISSIEMTISKGMYHIHCHMLICCPLIKTAVSKIQCAIQTQWKFITKDSYIVSFDLLTNDFKKGEKITNESDKNTLSGAIKEVMKYSTKSGNYNSLDQFDILLIAKWIKETKGMNFKNVSGLFRGLELTGCKSKYDSIASDFDYSVYDKVFVDDLANVKPNKPIFHSLHPSQMKDYRDNFKFNSLSEKRVDITDQVNDIKEITKGLNNDDNFDLTIKDRLAWYREEVKFTDYEDYFNEKAEKKKQDQEQFIIKSTEIMNNSRHSVDPNNIKF